MTARAREASEGARRHDVGVHFRHAGARGRARWCGPAHAARDPAQPVLCAAGPAEVQELVLWPARGGEDQPHLPAA